MRCSFFTLFPLSPLRLCSHFHLFSSSHTWAETFTLFKDSYRGLIDSTNSLWRLHTVRIEWPICLSSMLCSIHFIWFYMIYLQMIFWGTNRQIGERNIEKLHVHKKHISIVQIFKAQPQLYIYFCCAYV